MRDRDPPRVLRRWDRSFRVWGTDDVCVFAGLEAIGRVLKKAKREGAHAFGHSYKKSVEGVHQLDKLI